MTDMFNNCEDLEEIDISNINTASVKSLEGMFQKFKIFKSIDLSKFDTSKV